MSVETTVNAEAIPSFITTGHSFCVWKREERDGKPTKVPYDPNRHGSRARVNDPSTFASFDNALETFNSYDYDGIGIRMDASLVGVDLDHCIEHEALSDLAREIMETLDAYTEISPSGTGLHMLLNAPTFVRECDNYRETYRYRSSPAAPGLEVYVAGKTNRFLTLTGYVVSTGDGSDKTAQLRKVLDKYMRKPEPAKLQPAAIVDDDDEELINKAKRAKNGPTFAQLWAGDASAYPSGSEADLALCNMLAFWTGRDPERIDRLFRMSGLYREKWDRQDYREWTITKAIEGCMDVYTPKQRIAEPPRAPQPDTFDMFLESIQTTAYKPYKTGIPALDRALGGGIVMQSLVVVMAPPAMGKTMLVSEVMESVARTGQDALYLNLEMSEQYMYARSLSRIMGRRGYTMTATQILQGYKWTNKQRQQVQEAADIYRTEIHPHMSYGLDCDNTIESIEKMLERRGMEAKANGVMGPPVALDYLHLVTSENHLDATELVKKVVFVLKQYAIKYNTFVIAISATNRTANKSGRQSQSSGRDSSSIEYTADTLLSLNYAAFAEKMRIHGEEANPENPDHLHYLESQKPRKMIVHVHKHRMDTPDKGKAYLDFFASQSRFEEAVDYIEPDSMEIDGEIVD